MNRWKRCAAAIGGLGVTVLAACTDEFVTPADGDESSESSEDDGDQPPNESSKPEETDDDSGDDEQGVDEDTGESPNCGDGILQLDEECDGLDLGDQSCESMGASGTLRCNDDCTFDTCDCIWEDFRESCEPPVCGDGIRNGDEGCDGNDYGGDDGWVPTCEDVLGSGWHGTVDCSNSCEIVTTACRLCGDGVVQGEEVCDGPPLDDDGAPLTCGDVTGAVGEAATIEVACSSECTIDDTVCPVCGDGVVGVGEECEGSVEGTCEDLGWLGGTLECSATCEIDESDCNSCGNGVVDADEACDGSTTATCEENGFVGGAVYCGDTCELDLSHCGSCGDGVLDADEECEIGVPRGSCACTESCTIDDTNCISVVISEILYAPLADPDAKEGQWIELHNPTDQQWDMQGCIVSGDLGIDTFEIEAPLVIAPGGYATLGAGSDEELGFSPSYPMPVGVTLWNDGDVVTITCEGVELDTVTYGTGVAWPGPPDGTSIALGLLDALGNDAGSAWCASTFAYGIGQLGTPGAPNDCP